MLIIFSYFSGVKRKKKWLFRVRYMNKYNTLLLVVNCHNMFSAVSEKDHSDSDCLVIAVLTHGGEGKLYANDYPYLTDELWSPFAGDKCPTLAGKPKIFFIQVKYFVF